MSKTSLCEFLVNLEILFLQFIYNLYTRETYIYKYYFMWPTKRFLFGAIVATIFLWNSTIEAFANEVTSFVATAYYSPLPNQSKYTTWSYAGDVRLNWEWHTAASGKWVFPWLIAAPSNYPFGTKIYLEWYGIGSVEDRWWAIVKAWQRWHSYDRIDIWMWYGDEWLDRALRWGSRTITGKIVVPSAEVTLSFPQSEIWNIPRLSVNPEVHEFEDVVQLQEVFTKADLYTWEIDWEYESIKNEIINFQLETWIISSREEESAGWYGPKTIWALRDRFHVESDVILREEDLDNFSTYNHRTASEIYKLILEYWDLQVTPESWSSDISSLQSLLAKLWEYNDEIDWNYSSVEKDLIDLQIKIGLVNDAEDWGAWYFGNKTKSALWEYYEDINEDDINDISENIVEVELSIDSKESEGYILSNTEKKQLDTALKAIENRLEEDEENWKWSAKKRLENLKNQVNAALDKIEDEVILAKLIYLAEIL